MKIDNNNDKHINFNEFDNFMFKIDRRRLIIDSYSLWKVLIFI